MFQIETYSCCKNSKPICEAFFYKFIYGVVGIMAVIRDVNLDTTSDNIFFIGTIGGICLIVAVLGIKLRWFKHRMTFNDLPTTTTSIPTAPSNGMEPQIIRATFKPSSEFDNYVEVTPPKVLPPVRIHKSSRNAIPLPPRKRQAPEVPTLRISHTNDANETNEIEPLQATSSSELVVENVFLEERRKSTPPPPLPVSPPPIDHEESLLLSLEANYPYTESETIKIKEVHTNNETILPSPPPYQENDPLAHIHFKKFTKKKTSSTPLPPTQNVATVALEHADRDLPQLRKTSLDSLPSPKENKLGKRNSFLNQVPTPTEIPKLAFDFPSVSTPNLNDTRPATVLKLTKSNQALVNTPEFKSPQSNQSSVNDQPKSNEKKSLLEYFGLKMGSKAENDVNKTKNEKKVVPVVAKNEKKVVPVAPMEKQKVKKIRVLKPDKKEKKIKAVNEGLTAVDARVNVVSVDNARQPENNIKLAQPVDLDLPNEEIMENRMEIDYFQKVKKAKSNRIPIIVIGSKAEVKFEEKPPKKEVFRHEETFSAANGPLKVKKKKIKSVPQDTGVAHVKRPVEIAYTDVNQNISSSSKSNGVVPIPKPRVFLKLDGFDDDTRDMEIDKKPTKKVIFPVVSSPSSPSDTEDAWNLVAKHRLNTRAITATAISVRQKSDSDETTNSSLLQVKQLEMLNKPKTMREMKREQEERNEKVLNFGGKEDKESDTEA